MFCAGLLLAATVTSCFRPEEPKPNSPAAKIEGYWELVHYKESGWDRYYDENGVELNTDYYNESYDILPNDGNEQYHILRFLRGLVWAVAIDDPWSVDLLNVPIPYTMDGNKIRSMLFEQEHTNEATVTFNKSGDEMVLHFVDEGYYGDPESDDYYEHYEYCEMWNTYRRVDGDDYDEKPDEGGTIIVVSTPLSNKAWETIHIKHHYLYRDDNTGEVAEDQGEQEIIKENGDGLWSLWYFTNQNVHIVDTDNPEMVELLFMPIPYTYEQRTGLFVSQIVEGYYNNEATITFNENNTEFVLHKFESGHNGSGYEEIETWHTFRRDDDYVPTKFFD